MVNTLNKNVFRLFSILTFTVALVSCKSVVKDDELTILQVSDPQLGFFDDNKSTFKDVANFEKAIAYANKLKPDMLLITGDMINKPFDKTQLNDFFNTIHKLNKSVSLHYVVGNHDIGNTPSENDITEYRKLFGKDYYSIKRKNSIIIVLNSMLLLENSKVNGIAAEQRRWLKKTLEDAEQKNIKNRIVVLHHPLFLGEPFENDQYFNIPLINRKPILELFKKHRVSHVFSGHYHRNSFGKNGDMEMITTGPIGKPLGNDPSGIRIIKIGKQEIKHQYISMYDFKE